MLRMLLITALVAGFASAASAQAVPPGKEPNEHDDIQTMFGLIQRLTDGASPAQRLCYFTINYGEYQKCRFPHIITETWIGPATVATCRFGKLYDLVSGNGKVAGLGSNVLDDVSDSCDVYDRMRFEWKLIQRIKRDYAPPPPRRARKPAG